MRRKDSRPDDRFEDDGRTVADMNVEGMPWYTPGKKPSESQSETDQEPITLTKAEGRALMGGVVLAALLIAAVFALAILGFILFCLFLWHK